LVSYERVVARFPGVITARNIDVGSLISAGSSANVPVLYKLARINRMRIFIDVPQADSELVHVGQKCTIQIRELPGRSFNAVVTRFANALDVSSRTMRTEVQVDNPRDELLPGMYAEARFSFERKDPPLLIPANALVPSANGDQIVMVHDGAAHFQTIHVLQDDGAQVEVLAGVAIGDRLILNVNDEIREGAKVKVVQ
jgi:RND family efflux transporter MFP subunit